MAELQEPQIQHTLHSYEYVHVDCPFFSSLCRCCDTSVAVGARGFGSWSGAGVLWQDRTLELS